MKFIKEINKKSKYSFDFQEFKEKNNVDFKKDINEFNKNKLTDKNKIMFKMSFAFMCVIMMFIIGIIFINDTPEPPRPQLSGIYYYQQNDASGKPGPLFWMGYETNTNGYQNGNLEITIRFVYPLTNVSEPDYPNSPAYIYLSTERFSEVEFLSGDVIYEVKDSYEHGFKFYDYMGEYMNKLNSLHEELTKYEQNDKKYEEIIKEIEELEKEYIIYENNAIKAALKNSPAITLKINQELSGDGELHFRVVCEDALSKSTSWCTIYYSVNLEDNKVYLSSLDVEDAKSLYS